MHWREVEAKAEETFNRLLPEMGADGQGLAIPPVPIREFCYLEGLSVNAVVNLRHKNRKLTGKLDALGRSISYEATDILGRQSFTIAHELGHYILHWLPQVENRSARAVAVSGEFLDKEVAFPRFFRCAPEEIAEDVTPSTAFLRSNDRRQEEIQANNFAQAILMPAWLLRQAIEQVFGLPIHLAVRVLAQQFEVSPTAMKFRLRRLVDFNTELTLDAVLQKKHEQRFFEALRSGSDEELTGTRMVTVTPESRLRTLLSQIDLSEPIGKIELDFSPFHGADLSTIGAMQILDIALLRDHLAERSRDGFDNAGLVLLAKWPPGSSYVQRHLHRLGVLEVLGVTTSQQPPSYYLDDTSVGTHILLGLTSVNSNTDADTLAGNVSGRLGDWINQVDETDEILNDFIELVDKAVTTLVDEIVQRSHQDATKRAGYLVAQSNHIISTEKELIGYQVLISAGDVGVGVCERLSDGHRADSPSAFEATKRYVSVGSLASLCTAATHNGDGFLQINTGDISLNIGRGNTSFATGLYEIPGLQISVLLKCLPVA